MDVVLECIARERYDVVLLDLAMPDMNGIDVLKQLRVNHPDLPVLILSIHREDLYAVTCSSGRGVGISHQGVRL